MIPRASRRVLPGTRNDLNGIRRAEFHSRMKTGENADAPERRGMRFSGNRIPLLHTRV